MNSDFLRIFARFSRVTLTCVYDPGPLEVGMGIVGMGCKVLKNRDLECNKA